MWIESPVAASPAGLGRLLDTLWRETQRIDLALADPAWLAGLLPADGITNPTVRAVVARVPPEARPGWRLWVAPRPPSPELILAYLDGVDFPAIGLLLGGTPADPLAVVQRRPLVLRRLMERFESLLRRARPVAARPPSAFIPAGGGGPAVRVREGSSRSGQGGSGPGVARFGSGDTAKYPGEGHGPGRPASEGGPALAPAARACPRDVYRQVLARHFGGHRMAHEAGPGGALSDQLAAHQRRALERASAILDRYGGVIVADAVGLGKTFVGLGLLMAARSAGQRALVIAPAALRAQWRRHLNYLGESGGASAGAGADDDGQLALHEYGGGVDVVSMESLGRSSFDSRRLEGVDLVLVDEAHNFRNPSTNRYRRLSLLARHARVALLTATPINNSLLDLASLIDLFAAPGAFRHLGISDYRLSFRRGVVDSDVHRVVAACVVRRTRRFLRAHYGPVEIRDPATGEMRQLRFPRRLPPRSVPYDLDATYGTLLAEMETWLDALHFASLPDAESDDGGAGEGTAALLKIILLKRLESSVQAFRRSVIQQLAWCDTALRALASGRALTRPDYRASFRGPADDPGSQLALFELMLPPSSRSAETLDRFRRQLQGDRQLLSHIHRRLSGQVGAGADRKLEALRRLLEEELTGAKVIVFTEFRDTARYLHSQLRDLPHLALIDSGQARLGQETAARAEVITRFAPVSNGAPPPPAIERVDVLIATDVLSEGLNLQDAAAVVSYDLPWNPVRLMQRVGRIDRLGALADVVKPFSFVPAHQLDRLLGLMDRLQRKVSTIGAAFGLDQRILPGLGVPETDGGDRVRRLLTDEGELDRLEQELEGPPDPEELAYIDRISLVGSGFSAAAESSDAGGPSAAGAESVAASRREEATPGRTAAHMPAPLFATLTIDATAFAGHAVPVVVGYWRLEWGDRARALWLVYDPEAGGVTEDALTAVRCFRLAIDGAASRAAEWGGSGSPQEPAAGSPDRPAAPREANAVLGEAREAFARFAHAELARIEAARLAGDRLLPGHPQCRIAAWLARILEREELRLDAGTRTRIDRITTGLARRFTVQVERALAELAADLPDRPDDALMDRLQAIAEGTSPSHNDRGSLEEIGALLIAAG